MARVRALEAEKENRQQGVARDSSKLQQPTSSTDLQNVLDIIKTFEFKLANAEAQRKNDLEKAEAQRKKDLEKAEAQIKMVKKDLEKAEAKIEVVKKDLDNAEAQRNDLKDQVELLNREAATTRNEIDVLRDNTAATERYIEILAEDMEATTDFLALGEEASLDRIKRRNLLDRAQASLAVSLGLSAPANLKTFASRDFREALGLSSSLQVRQQCLMGLLRDNRNAIPVATTLLESNPAALSMLADRFPKVRQHGDQVAHGHRQRSWYEGSVSRSTSDKAALMTLLALLFFTCKPVDFKLTYHFLF
jgi:myosin heavy subunit